MYTSETHPGHSQDGCKIVKDGSWKNNNTVNVSGDPEPTIIPSFITDCRNKSPLVISEEK